MNIVVYTALFGNIDPLWSATPYKTQARFVAFTDRPRAEVGQWQGTPPRLSGTAPTNKARWQPRLVPATYGLRRTARFYKCNAHMLFPEADVTIWVDANVRLRIPPEQAVALWLHSDLATCNHPDRRDVYQEALACENFGKDDPAVLQRQVDVYRAQGMPEGWGLAETRIVLRRNSATMAAFNALWWAELEKYSCRDQIAFPMICKLLGLRWDVIPGRVVGDKHPQIWHAAHTKGKSKK